MDSPRPRAHLSGELWNLEEGFWCWSDEEDTASMFNEGQCEPQDRQEVGL